MMHLSSLVFAGLYLFILRATAILSGGREHPEFAEPLARVMLEERALFRGDESREREAALLTAIAFRESSFELGAVGDHGHSKCWFQIYGGDDALLSDPDSCVRTGLRMLRESVRFDSRNPVAFFARGPNFGSAEAKKISRDRVFLAEQLLRN